MLEILKQRQQEREEHKEALQVFQQIQDELRQEQNNQIQLFMQRMEKTENQLARLVPSATATYAEVARTPPSRVGNKQASQAEGLQLAGLQF